MSETKKQSRIPTFNSREEEAEFWDTHDTADFEDEFEPMNVRFANNLSRASRYALRPRPWRPFGRRPEERHRPHDVGSHVDPGTPRGD